MLSYRYRIKDRSAKKALARHAYACNQVWNWCVAQQMDTEARYRLGSRRPWSAYYDLAAACRGVGAQLGIHQQTVQEVCRQFAQSRDAAKGPPAFRASFGTKRRRGWVPFKQQSRQTNGNTITYLGKRFRFFEGGRPVPEDAKGGSFVEGPLGRWYVCFNVEADGSDSSPPPVPVGIDLGLKSLATTSDGEVIDNPRHLERLAGKLAAAQRAGSRRRARALNAKIADSRRDYHHKISTRLAREYAFIAVGNVSAKRLAKTKMAKSVFDAGWSTFRRMLAYKAQRYVEVDERFTTQTCSACGAIPESRPRGIAGLGIRSWDCSDCGASHDRDVNAARNILRVALGAQRPTEESREIAE